MPNQFLTNYTEITFLDKIKDNLRHCKSFDFSVSFIKIAGLILLYKDIKAAIERGCTVYTTRRRQSLRKNGKRQNVVMVSSKEVGSFLVERLSRGKHQRTH